MLFTFAGSSHNKYTGYLLDMITFLEIDAGPELRKLFLQNWLVNPSGEAGRYLEKDLMQEHHNDVLEDRIKKSGIDWDSKQMRDTHSRMVHHTKRIKKEVRSTVALLPKGWKHPKPHDRPEIKILLDVYHKTDLHRFRKGRRYRSSLQFENQFYKGVEKLPEKLEKWKTGLTHSDLVTAASLKGFEPTLDPDNTAEGEDELLLQANIHQPTGGHRELIDGELWMVTDASKDGGGMDEDEDE